MSEVKTDDNAMKWAIVYMLMGAIIGFGLAICIIDDRESFTLPISDKTFVRQYETEGAK